MAVASAAAALGSLTEEASEWLRGLGEEHLVACEQGEQIKFHCPMLGTYGHPIKESTGRKPATQKEFITCLLSLLIVRHLHGASLGLVWL